MYIERDTKYDSLYVGFGDEPERGEVSETVEVSPGAYLDFGSEGRLVGIEIVNTRDVLGRAARDLRLSGELMGVKEAATLAEKDRANFLRDVASRSDFPDPVARVASGQLWLSREVKRYLGAPEDDSNLAEGQTSRLPYTGWEGREEDSHKGYRYMDHEQYEDHEVMDTSGSAPDEDKASDDRDHEVFGSDRDPPEEQESA